MLGRGIFSSVKDLDRRILRYIHLYNRSPKPLKWTYRQPTHRITTTSDSHGTGY